MVIRNTSVGSEKPTELETNTSPASKIIGFPSPAENYLADQLDLNKYLIKHPAATFFVRATGTSMIHAVTGQPLDINRIELNK